MPKCDNWFIKFSCDFHFNQLAIGNNIYFIYMGLYSDIKSFSKFHSPQVVADVLILNGKMFSCERENS